MATAPKLDLRFIVRLDKSQSGEYGKFTARVVFVEDGRVRHPSGSWSGSNEAPYADLSVTAQCNRYPRSDEGQGTGWYGVEFGYHDVSSVDLRRAEAMAKTLRRVQTKLDKLQDEFGWSEDVRVILTRVAVALGIKNFAMSDSYIGDRYGQPMVGDYNWLDATGIVLAVMEAHTTLVGA